MTPRRNPYVGPRSFEPGETLYGRDREAAGLQDLVIAERIVLLYSSSGAGKTSLLHAKLLPSMEAAGFRIRLIRAGAQPSAPSANRFLRATLDSLGAAAQDNGLPQFLGKPTGPELLVFDQFEEVLNIDAANREAKSAFFTQLGEALRPRGRWALFSMREDYIAGLNPYLKLIPTRFAATYCLGLLDREHAIHAIRNPALASGVDFAESAAAKLAADLSGESPYVEPVQLQVVCLRLWDQARPDPTQIAETDLGGAGDVHQALAAYYTGCVTKAASGGSPERALRDWFDRRLISREGTRAQVLRGPDQGLPDTAIAALVDTHLIRSDQRHNATWFELSHDRLIEPVRESNRRWREANLGPLQRQAEFWDEQKRRDGVLLRGRAFSDALKWAASHGPPDPLEGEFIAACKRLRARHAWAIAAVVALFALAVFAAWNYRNAVEQTALPVDGPRLAKTNPDDATTAAKQARKSVGEATAVADHARIGQIQPAQQAGFATAGRLSARAITLQDGDLLIASLLAVQAWRLDPGRESQNALKQTSTANARLLRFLQSPSQAASLVFAPKGQFVVTAGASGFIEFWDPLTGRKTRELRSPVGAVHGIALSPSGQLLAAAGDHAVAVWDLNGQAPTVLPGNAATCRAVAFRDEKLLIAGGSGPAVRAWDLTPGSAPVLHPMRWDDPQAEVTQLAISPDGRQAALLSRGVIRIVNLADGSPSSVIAPEPKGDPYTAIGYNGGIVAAFNKEVRSGAYQNPKAPTSSYVSPSAHVSRFIFTGGKPAAYVVAALNDDHGITLWRDGSASSPVDSLRCGSKNLAGLAYSAVLAILATNDGALWDLGQAAKVAAAAAPLAKASPDQLAQRNCARTNRNLSMAEWQEYVGPGMDYQKTCPNLPAGEGVPLSDSRLQPICRPALISSRRDSLRPKSGSRRVTGLSHCRAHCLTLLAVRRR